MLLWPDKPCGTHRLRNHSANADVAFASPRTAGGRGPARSERAEVETSHTAQTHAAHLCRHDRADRRRLPIGAEIRPGGVHFRVWAPRASRVDVCIESERAATRLEAEPEGYHSGLVAGIGAGARYRYRLDGGQAYPDPASRFQPEGPDGPSCVVDSSAFAWSDAAWRGVNLPGQIIYEMHIGTFTGEGTYGAAIRELPELAAAGVTVLEVMPVAEFAGRFGWGYDGVDLFAPTRLYGTPDDLRRFVDQAHALGLAVILDVVYNHLGPAGNHLTAYSDTYFTDRYENEWGQAINFDGPGSGPVRELFIANAAYWIDEFHLDGLRLDATQQIFDASTRHILAEIAGAIRTAARGRATIVVAENERQHARLARPAAAGGYDLDGLWNDDFHHAAKVALTGRHDAYYSDYRGTPQELISAMKRGYLYQGQRSSWQGKPRGTPALDLPPHAFVTFIDNHDQISNSGRGDRCHQLTSPGRYRAMTALLLLGPGTPMLFQGQEFAASSPFLYFADHAGALGDAVRSGRAKFLAQFPSLATPEGQGSLNDPGDPSTFKRSKLDLAERDRHAPAYALHRDLIALRRGDPALDPKADRRCDGAVLGPEALALRYFGGNGDDRLLLVNLGRELALAPMPEPLLAPPVDRTWVLRWSSEDRRYGGAGAPAASQDGGWRLPGHAAAFLVAATAEGAGGSGDPRARR
jgi:maltooligosyltrehalose trehalohydrolase